MVSLLFPIWWRDHRADVGASLDDAATMLAIKATLFEAELKHHAVSALKSLAWWLAFAFFAAAAIVFTLLGLVWLAWYTAYREAVILAIPLLLVACAGVALVVITRVSRTGPLFPRSRTELARDRQWLAQWMK